MEFDCGPVEMPTKIQVSPVNTTACTTAVQNQHITQTMDRYRKKKFTSNCGTTQDDIGVMNSTRTYQAKHSPTSQFYQEESTTLQSELFNLFFQIFQLPIASSKLHDFHFPFGPIAKPV